MVRQRGPSRREKEYLSDRCQGCMCVRGLLSLWTLEVVVTLRFVCRSRRGKWKKKNWELFSHHRLVFGRGESDITTERFKQQQHEILIWIHWIFLSGFIFFFLFLGIGPPFQLTTCVCDELLMVIEISRRWWCHPSWESCWRVKHLIATY